MGPKPVGHAACGERDPDGGGEKERNQRGSYEGGHDGVPLYLACDAGRSEQVEEDGKEQEASAGRHYRESARGHSPSEEDKAGHV